MKFIVVVAKDGRPSMGGVFNKLTTDALLSVRRRIKNRRTGRLVKDFWRVYDKMNPFLDRGKGYLKKALNQFNHNNAILVRWGNTMELETEGSIVYNTATAIAKATDKRRSREILAEKGISVPRAVNPQSDNIKYPVIARPRKHAKGSNFIILNNLADFTSHYNRNYNNGWYYSEFVDKVKEYRVHCAHGRFCRLK